MEAYSRRNAIRSRYMSDEPAGLMQIHVSQIVVVLLDVLVAVLLLPFPFPV